jgi:chromate transport protein ChrA
MTIATTIPSRKISELVRHLLHLGLLVFGGSVVLVGQIKCELVDEREWLNCVRPSRSASHCTN